MSKLTPEQQDFLMGLIISGGPRVKRNNLPPAAMVACGCHESGFGTSKIYQQTNCPFNLQKPKNWEWPKASDGMGPCPTKTIKTKVSQPGEPDRFAFPEFCCTKDSALGPDLDDAARIWCEWILHWPNPSVVHTMLSLANNPVQFTRNLPLVGFGGGADNAETRRINGNLFVKTLTDPSYNIVDLCNRYVL
jgi:hypothetical protein